MSVSRPDFVVLGECQVHDGAQRFRVIYGSDAPRGVCIPSRNEGVEPRQRVRGLIRSSCWRLAGYPKLARSAARQSSSQVPCTADPPAIGIEFAAGEQAVVDQHEVLCEHDVPVHG